MQEISNSPNSINPDLASSSTQADSGLSQHKMGIQEIMEALLDFFGSIQNAKGCFDTVVSPQGQDAVKKVTIEEFTIQVIQAGESLNNASVVEIQEESESIEQIDDGDNVLVQKNSGLITFIFKKGTEVIKNVFMSWENIESICKSLREQTVLETMLTSVKDYSLEDIMVKVPDILEKIMHLSNQFSVNKNGQECAPFPLHCIDTAMNEGDAEPFTNIDIDQQQEEIYIYRNGVDVLDGQHHLREEIAEDVAQAIMGSIYEVYPSILTETNFD